MKTDYVKLYGLINNTPLLESEDGLYFTIADLRNYGMLKSITTTDPNIALVNQNLPDPKITIGVEATNIPHTHSLSSSAQTVSAGVLGMARINPAGAASSNVYDLTGDFSGEYGTSPILDILPTTVSSYNDRLVLNDRERALQGLTDVGGDVAHTHTASSTVGDTTYSTTNTEVVPNVLQLYMYIRSDI